MDTPAGIIPTYEFSLDVVLDAPVQIGGAGIGDRFVIGVTAGTVTGDRINGTVVGPAGDWLLVGSDGFGRVDVRGQIATTDGAFLLMQYAGLLEMNEAVVGASLDPAAETGWDEQYFRAALRLECGDDRYAWVNRTLFVARGRLTQAGVAYEVYRT